MGRAAGLRSVNKVGSVGVIRLMEDDWRGQDHPGGNSRIMCPNVKKMPAPSANGKHFHA